MPYGFLVGFQEIEIQSRTHGGCQCQSSGSGHDIHSNFKWVMIINSALRVFGRRFRKFDLTQWHIAVVMHPTFGLGRDRTTRVRIPQSLLQH